MVDPKKLKSGQKYQWFDLASFGAPNEIVIVGYDPLENKWVAACKAWSLGLSYLDEEDFEQMVLLS